MFLQPKEFTKLQDNTINMKCHSRLHGSQKYSCTCLFLNCSQKYKKSCIMPISQSALHKFVFKMGLAYTHAV